MVQLRELRDLTTLVSQMLPTQESIQTWTEAVTLVLTMAITPPPALVPPAPPRALLAHTALELQMQQILA
jgi:hypothetical protein